MELASLRPQVAPEVWEGLATPGAYLPDELEQMSLFFAGKRQELQEQFDLERLVTRPQKKGHLPDFAQQQLFEATTEALAEYDRLLALIAARKAEP